MLPDVEGGPETIDEAYCRAVHQTDTPVQPEDPPITLPFVPPTNGVVNVLLLAADQRCLQRRVSFTDLTRADG